MSKKTKVKLINWLFDFLMFVVPLLEMAEVIAVIPIEYLPWYMLASVIARRSLRVMEDKLNAKTTEGTVE